MSSILLVGCGKMGSALVDGWLSEGRDPASITVIEPQLTSLATLVERGVQALASDQDLPGAFAPELILFAVKPQVMDDVIPPYARFKENAVYMSIAAGRTMAFFRECLGVDAAIVRVMPNTPAAIGRGISGGVASDTVQKDQLDLAASLMQTAGEFHWLTSEDQIDAVTAVSGSGPAYVFLLAECLAEAAKSLGLPEELAERLGRMTVAGSGELLHQSDETAATLRQNVTSPGGTTEAALRVLMADAGLQALLKEAAEAAFERSRKLAGS